MRKAVKCDIRRYRDLSASSPWLEPSVYYVMFFRLVNRVGCFKFGFCRKLILVVLMPFYKIMSVFYGISLPRKTAIGNGFVIFHYSGIAINEECILGENVTIRQNVTIGNKGYGGESPRVGNDVDIGAGAVIIGGIKIGNNVSIGANAVVLKDIPENHIAVGNPARVIEKKNG